MKHRAGQDHSAINSPAEISKKELLRETNISYGQFYRWKRMGLIPESWFRRRSTFTGQEAFLPREKVLGRIRRILAMREESSLDQIASLLCPDPLKARYGPADIGAVSWLSDQVYQLLPGTRSNDGLSFLEVLCLAVIQYLLDQRTLSKEHITLAAETLLNSFGELDSASVERRITLTQNGDAVSAMLHEHRCIFDKRTVVLVSLELNELIERLKVALRDRTE